MNSPLNILLVEDSLDDAQLILLQLEQQGIDVTYRRVETEADFIAALDSPTDLILSDFAMPQFSGLQAIKILKEKALDIPFILVSGTIGEEVAVEAMKQGVDDYLMKDRLIRLSTSIQIALNQKKLRDEKIQTDIALRDSEARFRSLIENSSDEVSIISADGTLLYESPSSNPTLGYKPGEFLTKTLFELVHPDDLQSVQNHFVNILQDPTQHPRQRFRLLHSDGKWIWVEAVATNLLNEPSVMGIVVNYHDVTESVQAEKKIQSQLKRLSALHDIDIAISNTFNMKFSLDALLNEAILLLDVNAASILLFNQSTLMLEYMTGKGFRSSLIEQTQLRLGEGFAGKAALERRSVHVDNLKQQAGFIRVELLKEEGFVTYFALPLTTKGELQGILEIFHREELHPDKEWLDFLEILAGQAAIAIDNAQLFENLQNSNAQLERRVMERTAELNRTNHELERANRAKDEFLANMSHELRTPLNSILGLSESLLEQYQDTLSENQLKSLQIIETSGRHLLDLINDVLDLSKLEAGMFDYYPQLILPDDLCKSSIIFVKSQAMKKNIALNYEIEESTFAFYADPRRLKQILVNLLTNAVKFTADHGKVNLKVNTNAEKEVIQFSVIDTGIGIAPEDLKRLFTPFVQVDSSLNRHFEGTGLGLALVHKLIDLHGGSVEVESEVGKGSRFTINLPYKQGENGLYEQVEQNTPQPADIQIGFQPKTENKNQKILLVEDNEANILTIGEYLENYGYEIIIANDGLQAIEKANETLPHIILMDIQMPTLDGLEATRRLRTDVRFASTPIIALTALAMPGDRERCLEAGANEYMSKPVSLKGLRKMIEGFLDSPK